MYKRQSRIFFFLISGIFLLCACSLIPQQKNLTPTPGGTNTPEIRVENLPRLPILPDTHPTVTPQAQRNFYEEESHIFSRSIPDQIPTGPSMKAVFTGKIVKSDPADGLYSIQASTGENLDVSCGDYCFYVDDQKQLLPAEAMKEGMTVLVFGSSNPAPEEAENVPTVSPDETSKIIADAIAVDMVRSVSLAERADMTTIPNNLIYTEYELTDPPKLDPLTISDKKGSLADKLQDRLLTTLADRTNYSQGLYGENYTSYSEYTSDDNRDPAYPTRAHMLVLSNGYDFYDFWFPYTENPMYQNWGILCYGGDWFMPIRMSVDIDPDPAVKEVIYSDRTIMSQINYDQRKNYLRSFGYSVIDADMIYFYETMTGYGVDLNYVDYNLGFDLIPFGYTDSYQELNPFYADTLVAFFGRRGKKWYYVEIKSAQ